MRNVNIICYLIVHLIYYIYLFYNKSNNRINKQVAEKKRIYEFNRNRIVTFFYNTLEWLLHHDKKMVSREENGFTLNI